MKIGIIGVGFVGGTTAEVIGRVHEVFLYDKYKGSYNSAENISALAKNSEIVFLCVPTPMKPNGKMDPLAVYDSLDILEKEAANAGRDLKEILVVVRSTVVPGTTDKLSEKYSFRFAFNPEFLREKHALEDMKNTKRIIIGTGNLEDFNKIKKAYEPLFPRATYIHENPKTAETIKYCANVMLAGQISLANELYNICNSLGINYASVKNAILLDERIGRNIDVPGPDGDFGFGGKCLPKDINALIYLSRENFYRPYLLEEIVRLNEAVRRNKDWLEIPGATSENSDFEKESKISI